MSGSRPELPDFTKPPVIEVVLSVQFVRIEALDAPHLGVLWERFRDKYPRTEQHPPIARRNERFDEPGTVPTGVRVEFVEKIEVPRCWFLNSADTELIQVQQDRFIHNWRKVGQEDEYPRFEHIRDQFSSELSVFRDFLSKEELGQFAPDQCEITYINHIVAGEGWETHGELGNVLTVWGPRYSDDVLAAPEATDIGVRYTIYDDAKEQLGRLHITSKSGFNVDKKPTIRLELTARGRPEGEGTTGVLNFLERGRKHIVRGFASVTTPEMHKIWGRCDGH